MVWKAWVSVTGYNIKFFEESDFWSDKNALRGIVKRFTLLKEQNIWLYRESYVVGEILFLK